jgi:hypothetical protein
MHLMKKGLLLLLLIAANASAQRFEIYSGDFKNLKDITEFNVTFDYSQITVHGYQTEAEYLEDKMKKRASKEGKAQQFHDEWFANRKNMYEPAFINYFNKSFKNGEIKVSENPVATYTMEIKTTWVYPGYDAGTDTEPAKISAVVTVRETANPTNVLLSVFFERSIGLSHQIGNSLGDRISWAYEKIAKNLMMQLKRFI